MAWSNLQEDLGELFGALELDDLSNFDAIDSSGSFSSNRFFTTQEDWENFRKKYNDKRILNVRTRIKLGKTEKTLAEVRSRGREDTRRWRQKKKDAKRNQEEGTALPFSNVTGDGKEGPGVCSERCGWSANGVAA